MTREEILNMRAGREMDALIAEKVMQHWVKRDVIMWQEGIKRKEEYSEGFTTLAHYSTDIADAWTVVEKMKSKHFRMYYKSAPFQKDDNEPLGWTCSMSGFEFMPEHADTAPLAICRAALLAVMEAE